MKKNVAIAVAVVVLLAAGVGGYWYWKGSQQLPPPPKPVVAKPVQPPVPQLPPPAPEPVPQVVETPPPAPPLPQLADSDSFVLNALTELVGNKRLMKWLRADRIIHNIVATIDNLPRKRAPYSVMPVRRVPGQFIADGAEDEWSMSPRNASRYRYHMMIADAIDPKQAVALYVRLYPLFQEAYERLGYPKKYFNDRLLFVIDHLLEAPDIKEPVELLRPNVMYEFRDAELEARSGGQKIMMRIGSSNEAKLKAKLRAIKQELLLHMHDKQVDGAEQPGVTSQN